MTATMTMTSTEPRTVETTLNYYLDPSKGGHTSYQIGVADYHRRKFEPHQARIQDIRGREDQFNLETHGFQHHKHVSAEKEFVDNEQVKKIVYPEVEQLLKDLWVVLLLPLTTGS